MPKKVKFFFSAAVQMWDADFYIKVDDNVDLNFGKSGNSALMYASISNSR